MVHKFLRFLAAACLYLLLLPAAKAQAPATATISGTVYDGKTNETLPGATLLVLNQQTKAQVKVAQTDVNGKFSITAIPFGSYTFKITFVGYQTAVRQNVILNVANPALTVDRINLQPSTGNALKEVTVTAKRPAMTLGVDRKVFQVDQSLVSDGGSATDLLNNIPSVQTDMDGNVSLRGADNVRVLIDGRPSNIAGGNVAQILQSIPANSIQSVELITNPSSKYDAAGGVGILNIVLKKNARVGTNGGFSISAGNRDTYNASADLAYRTSKFNVYGNYGFRTGKRNGGGYSNLHYYNPVNGVSYANQNTTQNNRDYNNNAKVGVDWYISDQTSLGVNAGFNFRNEKENEFIDIYQLNAARQLLAQNRRTNTGKNNGNNQSFALDGLHKFKKKGEELSLNASFGHDNRTSYNDLLTTYTRNSIAADSTITTNNPGFSNNYNVQLDYVLPLSEGSKFEAGYKTQILYNNSNQFSETRYGNGTPFINEYLTNNFKSNDRVHAVYANYQNKFGNFGYQLGLRLEDALLKTDYLPYSALTSTLPAHGEVKYTRLYPSVFLSYNLPSNQQLSLSYTRRVERPNPWDINPFRDISEPFSQRQGNPNLKPEDVHSFELAYMKTFNKVTLTTSAYYRRTNDSRQRITTEPDANGVTLNTPINAGSENDLGFELISRVDITKGWNLVANANLFERILEMPAFLPIYQKNSFTWNANLTNNINITPRLTLQLRADYRAKRYQTQGVRKPMWGIDGGAKYSFADKKSTLSLNARDIFNTRAFGMENYTKYSQLDFKRRFMGTMVNLTYTYRFGSNNTTPDRRRKANDNDRRSDSDEMSF